MKRCTRFSQVLATSVAILLLSGCGSKTSGPPLTYLYVIDYSKSTSAFRKQEVGQMLAELEAAPDNSNVVIYRMGFETEEIFSGQLGDAGTDSLIGTLNRDVVTSDPKNGTNFAKMTDALLSFSREFKGDHYKVRIMTDGANDFSDLKNLKTYHANASLLALDSRISSLRFYGVEPAFRHDIRRAFGAAGCRLQIINQDQTLDN
jgi:hypothetical protein